MKETKIYADEFCTTFASTTEMLEFLAERAKQSKWIRKPTRMLKLVPLEKEAETIEEACEKELEGIVEDTEKNTQLVLKVNKDFYPVRDCAIHTILKRAGINGTGLKKLEKATYAKVVNYCLQVAKGDALIKVADGKVSAVHGGDDHDYCVLDMQTIFNMTSDYLKAHFNSYWENTGYVMQRTQFFNDTVRRNMGLLHIVSEEEMDTVAKCLDLYDEIHTLEMVWDTEIKIDPCNFSEGQMRRLDIMRNILKNSQILIFDEATANIDEKRRGRFYQLLHALSREKIIIFSTHNLEELREADIIVDLEKLHIRQVSEK